MRGYWRWFDRFRLGLLATLALGLLLAMAVATLARDPDAGERQLAETVARFCARELGDLPAQGHDAPSPAGRAYAFRAATNGLVVLVLYGFDPLRDGERVRRMARVAFARHPALRALSVEYYHALAFSRLPDGSYSPRRESYIGRQTLTP